MQLGRFDPAMADVDAVLALAERQSLRTPRGAVGCFDGDAVELSGNEVVVSNDGHPPCSPNSSNSNSSSDRTSSSGGMAVVVVEEAVVRKAQRLRQLMRAASKKSELSLKKAFGATAMPPSPPFGFDDNAGTGVASPTPESTLAGASIFSSNREEPNAEASGNGAQTPVEHPRLERLRLRREAEEAQRRKKAEEEEEKRKTTAAGEGRAPPLLNPPPPLPPSLTSSTKSAAAAATREKRRDLDLAEVKEIQDAQRTLFASPTASAQLEAMRFQSELHEVRFLHRLKPFKLELQRGLLAKHGFEPTEVGLREMERAVARRILPATPEVGKRAKALMCLIMGDIWDESAAL
mmetsp:Transcript_1019/g.2186  ORF Transcript_1019/g.2186 Transcript_1019/m.2186 type:complete len:349 (-) Transcript_1019:84-1130(-)